MTQQLLSVRRIERINDQQVRLTLIPVQDPNDPKPWGEQYIDVPVADEVPTGTQFTATYERVEE